MAHEDEVSYQHILKYTGVFGGVQGLNIIISLVRNKLVALLLGPMGMGLSSLFNTTVAFLSQATNLGVSFSGVRYIAALYEQADREALVRQVSVVRAWSLLTALMGMLVCIVLGPWLSQTTFAWGNHTLHFLLLSPAIGMLAVTGGETAILKGTRSLGSLAWIQVLSVLTTLLISVPAYYVAGVAAVVPVIVAMSLVTLTLTLLRSCRVVAYRLNNFRRLLSEGSAMVRLGIAYTLAAVAGSGAEMAIRAYLNVKGDPELVGLYNAGFMLIVTYAGMVFSALESDYFPRLSGVHTDVEATNLTVNRQMEVSLLLVSPMLSAMIIFLPLLIPLLFSSAFMPVVAMAQVAALAMYLKVLTLPVAYITLARGRSVAYFFLEAVSYVVLVVAIVWGFSRWGLFGTGVAIVVANAFDCLLINLFAITNYGYRPSVTVIRYAVFHLLLGGAAYLLTLFFAGSSYWLLGCIVCLLSGVLSFSVLHRKTHLWQALTRRFRR